MPEILGIAVHIIYPINRGALIKDYLITIQNSMYRYVAIGLYKRLAAIPTRLS